MFPEDSRGLALVSIATIFTILSFVTIAVRLLVRRLDRLVGWDDWTALASFVLLVLQWILVILAVDAGLGVPGFILPKQNVELALKYSWLLQVLCFITVALPKISICIFILRIKNYGWLKWFLYSMIAGLLMTNMACLIILLAECSPISSYWISDRGSCWGFRIYDSVVLASVGFSIFSDVACMLLPIVVLWEIKISWRAKAGVSGLMSLGLISTVAAIYRALLGAKYDGTDDPAYNLALPEVWAVLEQTLSLIGANCALSRHAYKLFRNRRKSLVARPGQYSFPPQNGTRWGLNSSSKGRRIPNSPLYAQDSLDNLIRMPTEIYVAKEPHSGVPIELNDDFEMMEFRPRDFRTSAV